jgi:hypothetical protein
LRCSIIDDNNNNNNNNNKLYFAVQNRAFLRKTIVEEDMDLYLNLISNYLPFSYHFTIVTDSVWAMDRLYFNLV